VLRGSGSAELITTMPAHTGLPKVAKKRKKERKQGNENHSIEMALLKGKGEARKYFFSQGMGNGLRGRWGWE
jgi:hypothetical protein